jgi:hypothetical protein
MRRIMPHGVNRLVGVLLWALLTVALATPAFSAGPAESEASVCAACCAASPSMDAACDETSIKPLGAWFAGVVRPAYIAPVAKGWAMAPASPSLGPPDYLSFGRLLL